MATPSELYKAGKLKEAIDAQIQEVRNSPGDNAKRFFLFELLLFAGDLDRAQRQVDAINFTEPEMIAALAIWKDLLNSERMRRKVFKEGEKPKFLTPPTDHVQLRLDAVQALRQGKNDEAGALLAKAAAITPPKKGQLNGVPFSTFHDCDDLFSGILEVMHNGLYYWVPLENIAHIEARPPKYPRDLYAVSVELEVANGENGEVLVPALYPLSYENSSTEIQLGHATDLRELGHGMALGSGARTFFADDRTLGLVEWQELVIEQPEAPPAPAEAPAPEGT
jgi:type VI secretion system protein ImpE